jgi:hypothetical protein
MLWCKKGRDQIKLAFLFYYYNLCHHATGRCSPIGTGSYVGGYNTGTLLAAAAVIPL